MGVVQEAVHGTSCQLEGEPRLTKAVLELTIGARELTLNVPSAYRITISIYLPYALVSTQSLYEVNEISRAAAAASLLSDARGISQHSPGRTWYRPERT